MNQKNITIILILIFIIINIHCYYELPEWIIEEIKFPVRDNFILEAYLLRPKLPSGNYPAVICFHQCWGNRDDFLKLFPFFAEAGIVAISANYPRLTPSLDPRRYTDLADTITFAESIKFIDKNKLGIVTASLSVNTGLIATRNKKNVIANVMLSGPVIDEKSKKWITINSDMAIFTITSLYDGNNSIFMKELNKRSLNPLSRNLFINDVSNKFSINAHGTFVFDEYPDSILKIQKFFMDTFNIKNRNHGYIPKLLPKNTIIFPSSDGMPITATFIKPDNPANLALILYPPRYYSRTFYKSYIEKLASKPIIILAPNTKRTCRTENKLYLCEREIIGAVNYLKQNYKIKKIIILFPSFYFLAAKYITVNKILPDEVLIFAETRDNDYGINPEEIKNTANKIYYIKHMNVNKIIEIVENEL